MKTLDDLTEALKQVASVMEKQKEMNVMVIKALSTVDQELELLKVGLEEIKKEVRACRA